MKPHTRWHWLRRMVVVAFALVVGAAVALAFARVTQSAVPIQPAVLTAVQGDVERVIREVGTVEPLRRTEVKSRVAGQVVEVFGDVGQEVKAGEKLMRLDSRDARRAVAQVAAKVHLDEVQLASANELRAFKERQYEAKVISLVDLRIAQAECNRLKAQIAMDRTELDIANDNLSYTDVRSPMDGVILARNVQPGELVTPGVAAMVDGKPLLVVARIDKVVVCVELNQLDVAQLHENDSATLRVDAVAGATFAGSVRTIAAMGQRSERRKDSNLVVFPVEVLVDRAQPRGEALKPGMLADVLFHLSSRANVLTLPIEGIAFREGVPFVRKVRDGVHGPLSEISLGVVTDRVAEVVAGVEAGDRVYSQDEASLRGTTN